MSHNVMQPGCKTCLLFVFTIARVVMNLCEIILFCNYESVHLKSAFLFTPLSLMSPFLV